MDDPDQDAVPDSGVPNDADESESPDLNPLPDPPPASIEVGEEKKEGE